MTIKFAQTEEELHQCWEAISALRPNLESPEKFVEIFYQMQKESYQLLYAKDEAGKVMAVAGFRYMTMLYAGKFIYIDDLSTLPEGRGKGYAGKLLDYIIDLAKKINLNGVHLDSGHLRFDAHRLYLNKGFKITSHHFMLALS